MGDKRAITGTYIRLNATYYQYSDGTVVAFGRELDPPGSGPKWIASVWSTDPINDKKARHLGHLCVDATAAELTEVLHSYRTGSEELI